MDDPLLPWIPRALTALDLRRRDRLMLVMPGSVAVANAAASLCGDQGALLVLEPRRAAAETIAAALPAAEVLALEPAGSESFGSFDALLAAPLAGPLPPVATWAAVVGGNLRPGGRFAIDLPGAPMLADVQAAAEAAAMPLAARLAETLVGPDAEELTATLAATGLRRVQSLLGTHLLKLRSPFDLVDVLQPWVRFDDDERAVLGEALARQLRGTADVETLARRSSVAGMR